MKKRAAGLADCSRYIYAAHWIIVIECIDYVD